MANGAAAHLPVEIGPATSPPGESAAPSTPSDFETAVAEALADAAVAAICAMAEHQDGGLRPGTKARGGVMIARLYKIQTTIGEREFSRLVRQRGRQKLRDLGVSDRVVDITVDWLLEVLVKVTADVRACN
jgi:hypothetical protein